MKLRDYKFESKDEIDIVANSVLLYNGAYVCPEGADYSSLMYYKMKQLDDLVGDNYNITPRELMMYLSCPVGVENAKDIKNFGIRTNEPPYNGKINMFLSEKMLFYSLFETGVNESYIEKLFDYELDKDPTLTDNDDVLEMYAPSMLEDTSLLYYLFLTGRGDEFTRIYGDVDFLKTIEETTKNGPSIESEVNRRIPHFSLGRDKASKQLLNYVKEDNLLMKKLKKQEEINVSEANKLSKGV